MDKNAIKKYAIWAREELLHRVSAKAQEYGITSDETEDAGAGFINDKLLTDTEKKQRTALIAKIRGDGYEQALEEIAYTWFNRFIALRFMEVNGYLPTRVRVFTDDENHFRPQILAEAIHLDLPGLDVDKVIDLKQRNDNDALYKYLLITQCNALNAVLPDMFQKIDDYTELLFPDNILREGSVLARLVSDIPAEDWTDHVQIIGWLYQYYNTELKAKVFARPSGQKINKEDIPAATQLFTPDWIVRYMVENSLGRIFIDKRKNEGIYADGRAPEEMTWQETETKRIANERDIAEKMGWKYYLSEAEQTPEIRAQLAEIEQEYEALNVKDIKVIDPCSGSGHICGYLFDVLIQMYEQAGYNSRSAVRSIIENNLYGLDIDERAAQLTYFAVMMKGCRYDGRFLTRTDAYGKPDVPQPRVYAITESNGIKSDVIDYFVNGDSSLQKELDPILHDMRDAKEYGSLVQVTPVDFGTLYARFDEIIDDVSIYKEQVLAELLPLVRVAQVLAQRYHVVCTNPPYMAVSNAGEKLQAYIKKNYPDSKADLFAAFIERCGRYAGKNGYQAMVTMHSWMFLSSFEKLRAKLQLLDTVNMVHLGARAFEEIGGEVVQTTSFVMRKSHIKDYQGTYCRLIEPTTQQGKEEMFLAGENRYSARQDNFSKIPGVPVAYWVSEQLLSIFEKKFFISDIAEPRVGMATANNERFIRLWFEVNLSRIGFSMSTRNAAKKSGKRWFPFAKGGEKRKWYGNNDYVVNWENDGAEIQNFRDTETGRIRSHNYNLDYIFQSAITWTVISSSYTSFRFCPEGFLYSNSGYGMFFKDNQQKIETLGLLNTKIVAEILKVLSPTIGFESGYLRKIPYMQGTEKVGEIVQKSVQLTKLDWDSYETSWDFKRHPMV